jgi:Histidine kinase-like ATPase domain
MATMTARRRLAFVVVTTVLAGVLLLALVAAAFAAVPVAIALATAVFALVVGLRSRGRRWWPRHSRPARWSAAEPPVIDGPSWTTAWDAPPMPSDLPATRTQVTAVLTEWDVRGEAAEPTLLVVTELLTNAVEHARPPLRVTLRLGHEFVRVEVCDATPEPPRVNPQEAEWRGHGGQIVAALALRHGWTPHPDGKTVWADVSDGWPE